MPTKKTRVQAVMNSDRLSALKKIAAEQGKSVSQIINDALSQVYPGLPPTTDERGGYRPRNTA